MTPSAPPARRLLVVEDDEAFRLRLAQAMERRGYVVAIAESFAAAEAQIRLQAPDFAVVDLKLGDGSGLDLVPLIRAQAPAARIVILTGYGNIATSVAAIKAGAVDYLPKPADADAIDAALQATSRPLPAPPAHPMSADRVRWEHIQRVFEQCDRNVSETARRLNMHRRTLQRILSKYAPREVQ
jgi:two-component system response regulator RegA